jgi:D-aspartate ligase
MAKHGTSAPVAVVMNMYYTGLGIARSLDARGIPVVGLSAHRRIYGNFTRHARIVNCPDSRDDQDELLQFMIRLANGLNGRPVVFPTRDHDLVFLDRFREQLEPYYALAIAGRSVLHASLDKWETYRHARDAGVPVPKCWMIAGAEDLERALSDLTFPCVLKPLAAHHWRKAGNWELVGARKACGISSAGQLRAEYAAVARADRRALVQQLIPGGDESLVVAACYFDRDSNWVAGFNTQKLAQSPPGFGTGCIVQSVDRPELFEPTKRLLQKMRFTGIAEVEYKWDSATGQYMLIEINPRPWDQHRLGQSCGVDLPYLAYCDLAGLARPAVRYRPAARKWIAEDTFLLTVVTLLWRGEPGAGALFRLLRGRRTYAIWDWTDPLPAIAYFTTRFFPDLVWNGLRALWSAFRGRAGRGKKPQEKDAVYDRHLEEANSRN